MLVNGEQYVAICGTKMMLMWYVLNWVMLEPRDHPVDQSMDHHGDQYGWTMLPVEETNYPLSTVVILAGVILSVHMKMRLGLFVQVHVCMYTSYRYMAYIVGT